MAIQYPSGARSLASVTYFLVSAKLFDLSFCMCGLTPEIYPASGAAVEEVRESRKGLGIMRFQTWKIRSESDTHRQGYYIKDTVYQTTKAWEFPWYPYGAQGTLTE